MLHKQRLALYVLNFPVRSKRAINNIITQQINTCNYLWCRLSKKRVKIQSYPATGLDRPFGLQEIEVPRISRQSAHEGGEVVSPVYLLISVTCWVDPRATVQPEGLYHRNTSNILSGMEPATCLLAAQCPNQLHHHVHKKNKLTNVLLEKENAEF
jgi:hypothetical protein